MVGPIFYDGALNGDSYNDMLNETIIPSVQHASNIDILLNKCKPPLATPRGKLRLHVKLIQA